MPADAKPEAKPEDLVTLRPFLPADLAAAFALDQVCFAEGIAYTRAELRHFVIKPNAYAVIAERAGQMAGFLVAGQSTRQKASVAHIVTLDVDPRARRAGVASLLMDSAESFFSGKGIDTLRLEVAVNNDSALSFYRSRGFVQEGFLPGYYNGVLDAITMKKALTTAAQRSS